MTDRLRYIKTCYEFQYGKSIFKIENHHDSITSSIKPYTTLEEYYLIRDKAFRSLRRRGIKL